MIRKTSREQINIQIAEEAAEWFVEFSTGEPDAEARRAFDAWLRKSPEHLRAYLELFPIWDDAALVDRQRAVDDTALVELSRAADTNVVSMAVGSRARWSWATHANAARERHATPSLAPQPAAGQRLMRSGWAALAASIVIAVVTAGTWNYLQRGVHATGIAEQRTITLPDGSNIELNARSKIRLRYAEHERRIELLAGQALFDVAKDHKRPFVVASGSAEIRAVGTLFDVYRKRTGTTVTVVEGQVAVHSVSSDPVRRQETETRVSAASSSGRTGAEPADGEHRVRQAAASPESGSEILLSAGEQLMVKPTVITKAERADIAAATAWRQRQLIFSATPLTEVAEEFNRYNSRQLVVLSPALADFNVSAVFSATDLASLLRFLRAQPGIQVDESEREVRISTHPG